MKEIITLKININGIVQGVGFRPYIYNLANKFNITGYVLNSSSGVEIVCQGKKTIINRFLKTIKTKPPEKSRIENIIIEDYKSGQRFSNFTINQITTDKNINTFISPDIALCDDCLRELMDKNDRRYLYPFINCTNCGPRYTIINEIPYDRINTTMSDFIMCNNCLDEYKNPADRRFHAQPDACHKCGPSLSLLDNNSNLLIQTKDSQSTRSLFTRLAVLLKKGEIIAIKGIGGFHLVCDATNEKTVDDLRNKKLRRERPFAIMVKNIKELKKIVLLSKSEKKRIQKPDRPIILLKKKKSNIAKSVSPNNNYLGIMLPYAPLHYLLFNEIDFPVVMTSANISDEPIIYKNETALQQLKDIASYFITGNRDINIYCDDSVTRIYNKKDYLLRRSRGIAPNPIKLNYFFTAQILALGAEQKNTICAIKNNLAFLSQHIGDIKNPETFFSFKNTIRQLCNIFDIKPEIIAYDLHPQYLNTQFALNIPDDFKELDNIPVAGIQHHHAHAVSCIEENNLNEDIIGIILDGTGYGTDDTIWGGEILIANKKDFKRICSFKPAIIPGGEISIKNVWRMGLTYIYETFKDSWHDYIPQHMSYNIHFKQMEMVIHQIKNEYNSIITSSCGRLFDGISSIAGVRNLVDYEGQAAIEFEQLIKYDICRGYTFTIEKIGDFYYISWLSMIRELLDDIKNNISKNKISYKFHLGLVETLNKVCQYISKDTGIKKICLSGGCFMNMFLLKNLVKKLQKNKFKVYTHSKVPCNDGGIALGQAVIAYNKLKG